MLCQVTQNRFWRHNLPRNLASKLLCIRESRKKVTGHNDWVCFLRGSAFWKTQLHFIFLLSLILEPRMLKKSMLTFLGNLWHHRQFWITRWWIHMLICWLSAKLCHPLKISKTIERKVETIAYCPPPKSLLIQSQYTLPFAIRCKDVSSLTRV